MRCEFCGREVDDYTIHHLVPKSEEGTAEPQAVACRPCHRMIHRLFSNKDLARKYRNVSSIKKHPEFKKFISWVKRQDPNKRVKVR